MTASKGLGTYGNAVGVVTPADHKLALSGLLTKTSGNAIRPGLFYGGNENIIVGKANMSYDVIAFTGALSRGASSGTTLGANDGTLNVTTTAAPGSNSRIDIIYWWQREYSLDGTDSNPVIGVVQGTAAASPTAPSLAAFPGALEIGRATVGAGITATTSATITQTAPFTAVAGGAVHFRSTTERDAVTLPAGTLGEISGALYTSTGSGWGLAGGDSGWLALTMSGGWVAFGSGYASPEYRKLNGIVYLRGLVKSGATTGTVATLPAGFRPGGQNQYAAVNNNVPFVLQVNTNGAIVIAGTASTVSLSLALAPFPADN